MKRWTIYCHTHQDTGRHYVGLTSKTMLARWNDHVWKAKSSKGGRWYFPNAIRKYGKDAFSHCVLATCSSMEEANRAEKYWIRFLQSDKPEFGFNLCPGGQHVPHPVRNPWGNAAYRTKMTPIVVAQTNTPQARANNKAALNTPESRARRSASARAAYARPEVRAKAREVHMGIRHTEETKSKLRDIQRSRPYPESLRDFHARRLSESIALKESATEWTCRIHGLQPVSRFTVRKKPSGAVRLTCRQCHAEYKRVRESF